MLYFAFTTLTTIGFGDFVPKGDAERLFGAFLLLAGVMVMTFVMGDLISLLANFQSYTGEYNEGDQLSLFFSTLTKFNEQIPINLEDKQKITSYFDHYWGNDLNQAFSLSGDKDMFDECPHDI